MATDAEEKENQELQQNSCQAMSEILLNVDTRYAAPVIAKKYPNKLGIHLNK